MERLPRAGPSTCTCPSHHGLCQVPCQEIELKGNEKQKINAEWERRSGWGEEIFLYTHTRTETYRESKRKTERDKEWGWGSGGGRISRGVSVSVCEWTGADQGVAAHALSNPSSHTYAHHNRVHISLRPKYNVLKQTVGRYVQTWDEDIAVYIATVAHQDGHCAVRSWFNGEGERKEANRKWCSFL